MASSNHNSAENSSSTPDPLNTRATTVDTPRGPQWSVFLSYHMGADQEVATALRTLIERSITPPPTVFAAGSGGLEPSKIGFKPQIQHAAQTASAFVALISHESKGREWIFYEAGAAWGRGQLYAPVLVDTKPEDLPSSIAGFQAVSINNRQELGSLVTSIANTLRADVKNYGRAWRTFSNTLEKLREGQSDEPEHGEDSDHPKLARARTLHQDGHYEPAAALYDEAEEEAETIDDKAAIRITRIFNTQDDFEAIGAQMRSHLDAYRESDEFTYNCAIFDRDLDARLELLNSLIDQQLEKGQDGSWRRKAMIARANTLTEIGRPEESDAYIRHLIWTNRHSGRVHAIAKALSTHALNDFEKLALSCYVSERGTKQQRNEVVEKLYEHAAKVDLKTLMIAAVKMQVYRSKTGHTINNLGIVYSRADLHSLAYRAYSEAAELGASVAKVNMANILRQGKCPAAALEILAKHEGRFDASDPAYPFRIRAEIEQSMHREESQEKEMEQAGATVCRAIASFMARVLRRGKQVDTDAEYQFMDDVWRIHAKEQVAVRVTDGEPANQLATLLGQAEPVKLHAFPIWGHSNGEAFYLFGVDEHEKLLALTCRKEKPYRHEQVDISPLSS